MNLVKSMIICCISLALMIAGYATADDELPGPEDLPPLLHFPNPLVMMDGTKVETREQWEAERRPELRRLFQHYLYGYMPPPPDNLAFKTLFEDNEYFDGKATLREVEIKFGPDAAKPIKLLIVIPNNLDRPAPVFLALNFCGNHTKVRSEQVHITDEFVPNWVRGHVNNRATEEARGRRRDRLQFEYAVERGYAVATFFSGDIDPDKGGSDTGGTYDYTEGIQPHYWAEGQTEPDPHEWGTLAAWAWGMSRAVDYLVTDPAIDGTKIATVGHSRNGTAALLAAAFDDRVAMTIPHQAVAPIRSFRRPGFLARNHFAYPHWTSRYSKNFSAYWDRLPFDNNDLVALMAPRPVMATAGQTDRSADPLTVLDVLKATDDVYRFLGVEGLHSEFLPQVGELSDEGKLVYVIIEGGHWMGRPAWDVFLDFADRWLKTPE